MTRLLRSLLEKADAIKPRVILWGNLGLAGLIALAHGGALLAVRAGPTPDAAAIQSLAAVSLPLAGLVALSSAAALIANRAQSIALGLQGVILAGAASVELAWGVSLLLRGVPAGNFSWSVGLFSASVCYAVFVLSRFGIPARLRATALAYFSPAMALAVAVPIDVGVFVRLTQEMARRFGA
jgi:hypothetical protein